MSPATPQVSILLPSYNGAYSIAVAIDSVIAQSYTAWELIIIDDASIDHTADIVADIQKNNTNIRYIRNNSKLGLAESLNKGLALSNATYIARIDDDDQWIDPHKLQMQMDYLEQYPETVLIGGGVIVVNEQGNEITRYCMPETDQQIRSKLLSMNCFIHSSVIFRKTIAQQLGGYDGILEDYGLWLKMGKEGKMANIRQYLVRYMMRSNSVNTSNKEVRMKQNIILIHRYKNDYPHYIKALILRYMELYFFLIFNVLPLPMKGLAIKIHKKF